MSTTDSTALQERIARALARQAGYDPDDHCDEWVMDGMRESAAAVLPIVEAEVRAASEKAWDEGCAAAEQYYKRTAIGVPGSDPIPAPLNPHRETGDQT